MLSRHPTARIIGRRAPCKLDMEKVADAALQNGKALEINSSCDRLDLKDEHVFLAVRKGVKLIVSNRFPRRPAAWNNGVRSGGCKARLGARR